MPPLLRRKTQAPRIESRYHSPTGKSTSKTILLEDTADVLGLGVAGFGVVGFAVVGFAVVGFGVVGLGVVGLCVVGLGVVVVVVVVVVIEIVDDLGDFVVIIEGRRLFVLRRSFHSSSD